MLRLINYILLDTARMGERINEAKELNSTHSSLYKGDSEELLSGVAPYLFRFICPTPFSNWYLAQGWGNAWGILLKSSWPMQELHKHFRKFLRLKTEAGEEFYFRFYDPRVLRIFLPACDEAQIREFFGPVDYFIMEDEDPAFALRFWHENGILKKQQFELEDIISKSDRQSIETSGNIITGKPGADVNIARPPAQQEITSSVTEYQSPIPKPKTKWNMFD